jgi:hypothetical protein
VMNTAAAIYHRALWREPRAVAYLHSRGIPDCHPRVRPRLRGRSLARGLPASPLRAPHGPGPGTPGATGARRPRTICPRVPRRTHRRARDPRGPVHLDDRPYARG